MTREKRDTFFQSSKKAENAEVPVPIEQARPARLDNLVDDLLLGAAEAELPQSPQTRLKT